MTIVLSSFRARQEAQERELAVEALRVNDGCVSAAARMCGLNRISFRRIIIRYELQVMVKRGSTANLTMRGNAAWRALADV
jgi:transcriptional regulator with GAF, ATPase, and Fis domain